MLTTMVLGGILKSYKGMGDELSPQFVSLLSQDHQNCHSFIV